VAAETAEDGDAALPVAAGAALDEPDEPEVEQAARVAHAAAALIRASDGALRLALVMTVVPSWRLFESFYFRTGPCPALPGRRDAYDAV
jgi:hypothetical protein